MRSGDEPRARTAAQLDAIGWLHATLVEQALDYWLFGGWAVDFHAGRVTRVHTDVDVALWQADLARVVALLERHGWAHAPDPGEEGFTAYEREGVRVELAFLARDLDGTVYTPIPDGRGEWPADSFGDAQGEVDGVLARIVGRASLIEDKSGPRDDLAVAAKDRADVALLRSLRRPGNDPAQGRLAGPTHGE